MISLFLLLEVKWRSEEKEESRFRLRAEKNPQRERERDISKILRSSKKGTVLARVQN